MSIKLTCPQCKATNYVNDRLEGREVRCPQCQSQVVVPKLAVLESESSPKIEISRRQAVPEVKVVEVTGLAQGAPLASTAHSPISNDKATASELSSSTSFMDEADEDMPKRPKFHDEELDMTAMVDVTFLLLIFFMVTASFSLQKSIESPRQQSDAPSSNSQQIEVLETDVVTVQINEMGSFLVLAPDWERETPGKQNLIRALREVIGDGSTAYKLAIEVHEAAKLQALVDCMDAGAICDYGEVQVTQVEGFD